MSSNRYTSKGFFFQVFLGCALVWLAGCTGDNDKVVQARVSERVVAFRTKKMEECRVALISDANKHVDSLMLQDARDQLGDSLLNRRPSKPFKPAPIAPIDSLTVKPVFESGGGR